jgi:hypothetical protein
MQEHGAEERKNLFVTGKQARDVRVRNGPEQFRS